MQIVLVVVGVVVLALTLTDVLVTTVAPGHGGGPITDRLGRAVWRGLRRAITDPRSRVLSASGTVVLILVVVTWLLGLLVGWFAIFSASPEAVVASSTGAPADGWTRLYYVGYTIFTLGIGDQVPDGSSWQVVTILATASGLLTATLAITYVLPVMTAVTERRQQATRIAALGGDAQAIVVRAWDGAGFDILEQILPALTADLLLTAERQLTYPILGHFHSGSVSEDHRVQIAALDEAVTLLRHGVDRERANVHPLLLSMVRHTVRQHIDRAELPHLDTSRTEPVTLDLAPLRAAGVPTVDDATFDRSVAAERDHRRHLVALAQETPFDWTRAVRQRPS